MPLVVVLHAKVDAADLMTQLLHRIMHEHICILGFGNQKAQPGVVKRSCINGTHRIVAIEAKENIMTNKLVDLLDVHVGISRTLNFFRKLFYLLPNCLFLFLLLLFGRFLLSSQKDIGCGGQNLVGGVHVDFLSCPFWDI